MTPKSKDFGELDRKFQVHDGSFFCLHFSVASTCYECVIFSFHLATSTLLASLSSDFFAICTVVVHVFAVLPLFYLLNSSSPFSSLHLHSPSFQPLLFFLSSPSSFTSSFSSPVLSSYPLLFCPLLSCPLLFICFVSSPLLFSHPVPSSPVLSPPLLSSPLRAS